MVAAGRYRSRPAVQIRSELYGFVWCVLSPNVIERFGNEHKMADVWEGKSIGVHGRLSYAIGGKLGRIEVIDLREITAAQPIDLDSVLDPNFTSGMDPHEYLRQLHDGELAPHKLRASCATGRGASRCAIAATSPPGARRRMTRRSDQPCPCRIAAPQSGCGRLGAPGAICHGHRAPRPARQPDRRLSPFRIVWRAKRTDKSMTAAHLGTHN